MLLPCQVVMMLAENVCGVPAACWTGVRAPRHGHGDANSLSKYRRTQKHSIPPAVLIMSELLGQVKVCLTQSVRQLQL